MTTTELRSQEQGMVLPMGHPWTEWPQEETAAWAMQSHP